MSKLIALVMAGGKGTRFWPESTARKPKQYLSLLGEESLLTQTLKRFDSFIGQEDRFIVTVKEQEALAQEYSTHHVGDSALIFLCRAETFLDFTLPANIPVSPRPISKLGFAVSLLVNCQISKPPPP